MNTEHKSDERTLVEVLNDARKMISAQAEENANLKKQLNIALELNEIEQQKNIQALHSALSLNPHVYGKMRITELEDERDRLLKEAESFGKGIVGEMERATKAENERDQLRVELAEANKKLAYVKGMGLQFSMMKTSDKPEAYLCHTWDKNSDHEKMFEQWSNSIGWENEVAKLKEELGRKSFQIENLLKPMRNKLIEERDRLHEQLTETQGQLAASRWNADDLCKWRNEFRDERDQLRAENAKMYARMEGEHTDDCPFCAVLNGAGGHSQDVPMCHLCTIESERETLIANLNKRIDDYMNELVCCNLLDCGCRGGTRLQQAIYEECGGKLRELQEERARLLAKNDELVADRTYNHNCINLLASATNHLGEKSEFVVRDTLTHIAALEKDRARLDWLFFYLSYRAPDIIARWRYYRIVDESGNFVGDDSDRGTVDYMIEQWKDKKSLDS